MLYLKNLYYYLVVSFIFIFENINMELVFKEMGLIIGCSGLGKIILLEILVGLVKCF